MKYLDKVLKETLRKYPIMAMLTREAQENYTFKGTKVTIEKGIKVWILPYGIQNDPDIFPNPDIFDPERFDEEAVAARHPMRLFTFWRWTKKLHWCTFCTISKQNWYYNNCS